MSATPETDALHADHVGAVIWPDFARRLERERDHYAELLSAAMKWVYACECENENRARMIADYEKLELTPGRIS